jgi:hypothetical protein
MTGSYRLHSGRRRPILARSRNFQYLIRMMRESSSNSSSTMVACSALPLWMRKVLGSFYPWLPRCNPLCWEALLVCRYGDQKLPFRLAFVDNGTIIHGPSRFLQLCRFRRDVVRDPRASTRSSLCPSCVNGYDKGEIFFFHLTSATDFRNCRIEGLPHGWAGAQALVGVWSRLRWGLHMDQHAKILGCGSRHKCTRSLTITDPESGIQESLDRAIKVLHPSI